MFKAVTEIILSLAVKVAIGTCLYLESVNFLYAYVIFESYQAYLGVLRMMKLGEALAGLEKLGENVYALKSKDGLPRLRNVNKSSNTNAASRVGIDVDGDGKIDGFDTDGDGIIDEVNKDGKE